MALPGVSVMGLPAPLGLRQRISSALSTCGQRYSSGLKSIQDDTVSGPWWVRLPDARQAQDHGQDDSGAWMELL